MISNGRSKVTIPVIAVEVAERGYHASPGKLFEGLDRQM